MALSGVRMSRKEDREDKGLLPEEFFSAIPSEEKKSAKESDREAGERVVGEGEVAKVDVGRGMERVEGEDGAVKVEVERIGFWSAVKLGFGFGLGMFLWNLAAIVVLILVVSALLGAAFRGYQGYY